MRSRIARRGRRRALGTLVACLAVPGSHWSPALAAPPPSPTRATLHASQPRHALHPAAGEDLARLRAELDSAAASAELAARRLDAAAARSAALRHAMDDLAERREAAQRQLQRRVRTAYMRTAPDPMVLMLTGIDPYLAHAMQGDEAGLVDSQSLIATLEDEGEEVADLRRRAEAMRRDLLRQAKPVFDAQDRARDLLVRAEAAFAADQAALAALRATKARLDALSARLTLAVAPAVTARGRRAAAAEAPIIAALEAGCCAFPVGYRGTGRTISGIASWYGPGFVGNPTASGSPYDPERLTAAMLPMVPLGTVVRVTSADGRAVNVLVNDRGPFGKGRVIDLSRAASRIMGFDGLKQVTVEILEPV